MNDCSSVPLRRFVVYCVHALKRILCAYNGRGQISLFHTKLALYRTTDGRHNRIANNILIYKYR